VLARVGGDEFAVFLSQTDADQAQVVADGIVKTLSRRVAVPGERSIRMTTSTETAAIANIEEAKAFAHRMRERGCQFALDDFGAGFGSFYSLKNVLPDFDGDRLAGEDVDHS
jgi:EAL domain-containing protein (putative c-di-GMP-specific phosphodiesterase class I)